MQKYTIRSILLVYIYPIPCKVALMKTMVFGLVMVQGFFTNCFKQYLL